MFKGKTEQEPDYQYFAIYDTKVGHYRMPMAAVNKFEMVREIEKLYRDPQQQANELVTNAEDFQVFKIGNYYKKQGILQGIQPEHVVNLHEIKSGVQRTMSSSTSERPVQQMGIVST